MKIEITKAGDGYYTVLAGGRIAPDLNWSEMLGLIASLTMTPGSSLQWLITPEQHAADLARRKAVLERHAAMPEPSGPPPPLCLDCQKAVSLSEPHTVVSSGFVHNDCFDRRPEPAPVAEQPEPGNAA